MKEGAKDYLQRDARYAAKVLKCKSDSHTEHDERQAPCNERSVEPGENPGRVERDGASDRHPQRKKLCEDTRSFQVFDARTAADESNEKKAAPGQGRAKQLFPFVDLVKFSAVCEESLLSTGPATKELCNGEEFDLRERELACDRRVARAIVMLACDALPFV